MAMKFDRCLGSNDANPPVKFQNDINSEYSITKLQNFARSYDAMINGFVYRIPDEMAERQKQQWLSSPSTSNMMRTKSQNVYVPRLVLQLSLPNPLKPGVKSRMKM